MKVILEEIYFVNRELVDHSPRKSRKDFRGKKYYKVDYCTVSGILLKDNNEINFEIDIDYEDLSNKLDDIKELIIEKITIEE